MDKPFSGAGRFGAMTRLSGALISATLGAAFLGGCATTNPFDAKIDKTSPAAAEVAELPKSLGPYPSWSQFPRGPQPIPQPSEFASRVAGVQAAQADLLNAAAGLQWTLSGTAEFAARARSAIDPALAVPAPADSAQRILSDAQALRAKATPPPVAR